MWTAEHGGDPAKDLEPRRANSAMLLGKHKDARNVMSTSSAETITLDLRYSRFPAAIIA